MGHKCGADKNSSRRHSRRTVARLGTMDGYDKLAAFIAADNGLIICRRFSILNAKNLLYLQAELVNLEAELRDIVAEVKTSGDAAKSRFP